MKFQNIKKTNYFIGQEKWNIIAVCNVIFEQNIYKVGITSDGLIKDAYIVEDDCLTNIKPADLPKGVYQNISSYYSDNWINILKRAS